MSKMLAVGALHVYITTVDCRLLIYYVCTAVVSLYSAPAVAQQPSRPSRKRVSERALELDESCTMEERVPSKFGYLQKKGGGRRFRHTLFVLERPDILSVTVYLVVPPTSVDTST